MKNHPLVVGEMSVDDERYPQRAEIDVGAIYIYKVHPGGKAVLWSARLMPHEVPNLDALRERVGGGTWEVKFRGSDDAGIVAISRFEIAGPEKNPDGSLVGGPPSQSAANAGAVEQMLNRLASAQVMGQQNAVGGGIMQSGALALIIPAALAFFTEMSKNRTAQEIATQNMMAALAQSQSSGQVALIQALMGTRTGENNGIALQESFMKGLDTMGTILGKVKSGEAPSQGLDWMEVLGTVVQNLRETVQAGAQAVQAVSGAAPVAGPSAGPSIPVAPTAQAINNAAA